MPASHREAASFGVFLDKKVKFCFTMWACTALQLGINTDRISVLTPTHANNAKNVRDHLKCKGVVLEV